MGGESATILIPRTNNVAVDRASEALLPPTTHVVVQNEIESETTLEYINITFQRSLPVSVIVNPAPLPFDNELRTVPWEKVYFLVLSEDDAKTLAKVVGALETTPVCAGLGRRAAANATDPAISASSSFARVNPSPEAHSKKCVISIHFVVNVLK